ncbi:hypothetical protein [Kitasatospora sp. NBC_01302]|uniref:hypothetical protein n=1 Tax=Kitasatospora sp. NBC_01302 TaxID=2903575 RepID=UPI002E12432E|nr:hypothetical protein OG294_13765 [Kitasatospora sp. NBC_01302]
MSITAWWRGPGRRRAVDRIPVLTNERDLWILLALLLAAENAKISRERDTTAAVANLLAADIKQLQADLQELLGEQAELAAWRTEAADPKAIREMTLSPVWGMDGLRPLIPRQPGRAA